MLSVLTSRGKVAALWAVVLAAVALAPQSTVHAQGSGSFGAQGTFAAVFGSFYETGATISEAVPADAGFQTIEISDQRRLHTDMLVRVDGEEMWVTALTETDPFGNPFDLTFPDTMTVDRAQNGTALASHAAGAKVKAKVARVSITVSNLTTPDADCDADEEPYSLADLAEDMDAVQTSVQITDQGLLEVGQDIKVAFEEMTVESLVGNVMGVARGQNGTEAVEHSEGTRIHIKTANPTPREQCGLGQYQVSLQYDESKARYISMVNETFLTSTGRSIVDSTGTCAAPDNSVPGTVSMSCESSGFDGGGKPIIGALGSGAIATALFEPLEVGSTISSLDMTGSFLSDIRGTTLSSVTINSGILQSMHCPDVNGNGSVELADSFVVVLNLFDRGEDSGANVDGPVDTTQTTIPIDVVGTLAAGDTIGVDFELMHVESVTPGPPASIDVQRAYDGQPARSHEAGTDIWEGTFDGNADGKMGYTRPRDPNPRVYDPPSPPSIQSIDLGDILTTVFAWGSTCPP